MVGCCAVGCTNSTGKGFIMKRFPSDPERRKAWAEKVNRENWTPTDASRLCVAHFTLDMFENYRADGKRMLRRNAIPTIFSHILQRNSRIDKRYIKKCVLNQDQSKPAIYYKSSTSKTSGKLFFQVPVGSLGKKWCTVARTDNFQSSSSAAFCCKDNFYKVSQDADHVKGPNATYCDEEENFDISRSAGIKIKVEPGLTEDMYQDDVSEDFFAGSSRLKEETNRDYINPEEHLDSMVDVENTAYIKQEEEGYLTSPHSAVKIKVEPGLNEDEASHGYIT